MNWRSSITKVWITIGILSLTFCLLVLWGIRSYQETSHAIASISKPNKELIEVNNLYTQVLQSDLHFNNYILTQDSQHWDQSVTYVENALNILTGLRLIWQEESVIDTQSIDSLRIILEEKVRINGVLKELKFKNSSKVLTEQVLSRIKSRLSDTAYVDKSITRTTEILEKKDTIQYYELVQRKDEKGLYGFIRKLLGKEVRKVDTLVTLNERLEYDLVLTKDSSIIRDYYLDTTLLVVKSIIQDLLREQVKIVRKLNRTELELVLYNDLLLNLIGKQIESITASNQKRIKKEQAFTTDRIEDSNLRFLIIAGAGILLVFILLYVVINDIQTNNELKKILEWEKRRAEELASAKEIFLSKMSHEIRTPLHSISGFADLLRKERLTNYQNKLLKGITESNQYLNELLQNILEQARLNSGSYPSDVSKIQIPQLCAEMELLFEIRKEEQNNVFNVSYNTEFKNQFVLVDGIKLKQIVINILSNAFKFTEKGVVNLSINKAVLSGQFNLIIEIEDNGPGLSVEDQEEIFLPFHQGSAKAKSPLGGTGLGLSISKHLLELLNGQMEVESTLGKGTKFTLKVPVEMEEIQELKPPVDEESIMDDFFPINVLIVEDDKWNAYLLELVLINRVNKVRICVDAKGFITELTANPFSYDLIISDLNLPDMDGKDLIVEIKKITTAPVIALSAGLNTEDYPALIKLGFVDALGKPFNLDKFLRLLSRHFMPEIPSERRLTNQKAFDFLTFENSNDFSQTGYAEIFIESIESKLHDWEWAIANRNLSRIKQLAHQLKSNFEQIGVFQLSEELQSVELLAELEQESVLLEKSSYLMKAMSEILINMKIRKD